MAAITSNPRIFPTEILAEIIANETLTPADLRRCQLVCRLFRDIVQHYPRCNYILRIGHYSQQTWRLVRCLLANPKIGQRFRSITIAWGRPHYIITPSGAEELLRWRWTEEEMNQISAFAGGILGPHGLRGVFGGVDCASLIPLLLYYMPNLEFVDLGYPDIDIRLSRGYLREQRRIIAQHKIDVRKIELMA
ncbi:hypothetical protein TWF225_003594 [Orbilia oligospora]|uniref:F-box domain-containing protein n=1 Tax=Orbilia oligospora TaxID=2813651 RepID=A0A7C8KJH0_ORBOL|nr:hypothetical protein TWF751_009199 [Orbilia oligospora]KAF3195177.1 hypothetical protein TWF225_003594 [Orbilia oligospora]KAF3261998.1 hypothetical protein TWF128_002693 [Orbilia oligospora]KAF3266704.1 hypothetical protein TWF217_001484 [Orbilia oligospora]KAF3292238.1 hypothetical protein TWF132_005906 [Orbilia oligospora]